MGEKINAWRLLVGKPERKTPLGRPRQRWVDNIKMDFGEIALGGLDWIGLVQNSVQWRAVVKAVMNLNVSYNAGKFLSGCTGDGLSKRDKLHEVSKRKERNLRRKY
jgi:hypothetical protein